MDLTKPMTVVMTLLAFLLTCVAGAVLVMYFGLYNVAGNRQHLQPVHSALTFTFRQSVRAHARDIQAPALNSPTTLVRGALCYQSKCIQCHGGPGVPASDFAQAMQPVPGPLMDASQNWLSRELYWITRNGIKMTGMPPWEHRISESDLWAVVAFLEQLPELTPAQFSSLTDLQINISERCEPPLNVPLREGDLARGKRALYAYACIGCHTIAGTVQGDPQVGPPLNGMGRRTRIAGVLDHTAGNMVRWLRETDTVKPGTAMPNMGVSEQDARDIAAYLATLR